jgi:DnaJ family protein C protein 9
MFAIIDSVPCSELSVIKRFQSMIENAIAQGEVEEFIKYKKVPERELKKREKEAKKEEKEAREALNALAKFNANHDSNGSNDENSENSDKDLDASEKQLKSLIQKNQKNRFDSLLAHLEEKYEGQEKSTKRKSKSAVHNSTSKKTRKVKE